MMKRTLRGLINILLTIISIGSASAAPTTQTFTIGVENLQYYPLHTVRNGQYVGFARDLLDAFAQKHGYKFEYVPMPINQLFPALLKEKTVDFKYPDNPQWQTVLKQGISVKYSLPAVVSAEGAMVLSARKGSDLAQVKTLGTVIGFTPWPYNDAIADKRIKLVTTGSFEGLLRDAMAGHLDAVYINIDVANTMLRDVLKSPGKLTFDPRLPYTRSDFSLSSVRHPEIIEEFNTFLENEKPLVDALRKKYGLGDQSLPQGR
jgi:ABC-type amino acid transport substrate-binding protein